MAHGLEPIPVDLGRLQGALENLSNLSGAFDHDSDSFMIWVGEPRPALSVHARDDIWVRYVPETGEVVGFEIENFSQRFLPANPDIQAMWDAVQAQAAASMVAAPRDSLLGQVIGAFREQFATSARGPLFA